MIRLDPYRRLRALVVPMALAVLAGCGSDGDVAMPTPTAVPTATATAVPPPPTATPVPTQTATVAPTQTPKPTATMAPSAAAACATLVSCGQCFLNERGECVATEACAARLSADEARCLNQQSGCDAETLGNCLLALGCGGGDDSGPCE